MAGVATGHFRSLFVRRRVRAVRLGQLHPDQKRIDATALSVMSVFCS